MESWEFTQSRHDFKDCHLQRIRICGVVAVAVVFVVRAVVVATVLAPVSALVAVHKQQQKTAREAVVPILSIQVAFWGLTKSRLRIL